MSVSRNQAEVRTPATYASLIGMCLIWGSTFLAIRIGNESAPPMWAAVIRLSIATVLYLVIARAARVAFPRGGALYATLWYGVLNYGVNFVLLYWGELRVPSGTAAVFYSTIPLTTGIFAALLGVHALRGSQILGAVIGLAGVVVISWAQVRIGAPVPEMVAIFTGATAASLSSVVLKKAPPHSTWAVNALGAPAGMAVCLAASFLLRENHALPKGLPGWGPILYLVLAGNLGAYALYGWLITKWKVTNVNVIALVIPVIAVLLGALVRAETLTFATLVGAFLVLIGVAITLFMGRH